MKSFDVVVLGAGPGGYAAAIRAAQLGRKVAIIDRGRAGGVCLNEGCIPSKALLHAATLAHRIRHEAPLLGITTGPVQVDLGVLQSWKSGVVKSLTDGVADLLSRHGVEWIAGEAGFAEDGTLAVDGKAVPFEKLILAAGAREVEIPFLRPDGETVLSARHALELKEIPPRLAIVGGGIIGLELGQLYARLGSEVTVFEMLPSLLPGREARSVKLVRESLEKDGVGFLLGTAVKGRDGKRLRFATAGGQEQDEEFDRILVSVGRRPNGDRIGAERAGIRVDEKGRVAVNARLATDRPDVFAIGDLVAGPQLAHRATAMGLRAAENACGGHVAFDLRAIPAVLYTDPEIAWVGLSEDEAKAKGRSVSVGRFPFAANGRSLANGEGVGHVSLVVEKGTDRILGAEIAGAHADLLIGEVALALEMGATASDLSLTVHPHPGLGETLPEAAEAVHQMAVHFFQRPRR